MDVSNAVTAIQLAQVAIAAVAIAAMLVFAVLLLYANLRALIGGR